MQIGSLAGRVGTGVDAGGYMCRLDPWQGVWVWVWMRVDMCVGQTGTQVGRQLSHDQTQLRRGRNNSSEGFWGFGKRSEEQQIVTTNRLD